MRKRTAVAIAAVAIEAYGAISYLGRTWGSTPDERRRDRPGDELVPSPQLQTDHAITIDAVPTDVWPWIVQVGWGRAGWYTYRWVDRLLFPRNGPSADVVLPEYQSLAVGDEIPDGPPDSGCVFRVEAVVPSESLVLRSTTHLPPRVRNAAMDWVWTYTLEPVPRGTRLHLRSRAVIRPLWLSLAYRAAIGADFVMARSHLRGIKLRAERSAPQRAQDAAPVHAPAHGAGARAV